MPDEKKRPSPPAPKDGARDPDPDAADERHTAGPDQDGRVPPGANGEDF